MYDRSVPSITTANEREESCFPLPGKVTAYPMTHTFHWPVTTIRHHQPGIIMFNRFYLGSTQATDRESGWISATIFVYKHILFVRGAIRTLMSLFCVIMVVVFSHLWKFFFFIFCHHHMLLYALGFRWCFVIFSFTLIKTTTITLYL